MDAMTEPGAGPKDFTIEFDPAVAPRVIVPKPPNCTEPEACPGRATLPLLHGMSAMVEFTVRSVVWLTEALPVLIWPFALLTKIGFESIAVLPGLSMRMTPPFRLNWVMLPKADSLAALT